jgi:biotin transport system substrate-specific component
VDLHVGIGKAISLGFLPFWIPDAIKCALAAGLLPSTWRLLGRLGD